ncbi:DMT family transporter [Desertibacillus haloalkaliphilus]|uniref:DMT family transporter n=1 Tax=Desertibacillus haloalkaliphilus TaxID=1328930 RepID=UPI001C279DFE|nr:EamA family transporter [Desertibacillus haloalkaliphilus]MBU8906804.1 EamA family transporter [Desertibacillus haloalkaliphilus]
MSKGLAYVFVILGASLWGITGLFVQHLYTFGFTPWEVVGIRLSFSTILLALFLLGYNRDLFKIKRKDFPYFVGTGVVSIAFFNYCFFTVMEHANLSIAVVLLYTAPVFVTLMSKFVFKESFTVKKLLALFVVLIGCGFTVGLIPGGNLSIGYWTLILGIGSGLFYALYSIFGKFVSQRYHVLTITFYSMLLGALFVIPTSALWKKAEVFTEQSVLIYGVCLALFATVLGYIFYTLGLKYVESSKASILSTIEPVVAIAVGVIIFGDLLTGWNVIGIVLILVSVLLTIQR